MAETVDNNNIDNSSSNETVKEPPQSPKIDKNDDNKNNTSSITSTDQLICKSPQQSHSDHNNPNNKTKTCDFVNKTSDYNNYLIYTGLFQILFGVLMINFGILTIINKASLSQLGGGIWGGGLATITGIIGILSAARDWCPLRSTAQQITHTIYLALSLICLATSQLIVAIAAIGLGRDFNNLVYAMIEEQADDSILTTTHSPLPPGTIYITLPVNYPILLYNIGLVIVSSLECLIATITSYKSSKLLCPCFRQNDKSSKTTTQNDSCAYRQAFVNNWLGKHNQLPQLFVVATAPPSTLTKSSKLEFPIFTLPAPPPPPPPQLVTYPLIPAPLGAIPSPIIPPPPPPSKREMLHHQRRYLAKLHAEQYYRRDSKSEISTSTAKSRSKSSNGKRNDKISDTEVAKTYTGLDKTIAEEFIDICDSRNNSLCSGSSCTSSSTNATNSDVCSGDYLVNNKN